MASVSPEARSMLKTVELDGVAVIQQKRILWALGWGQDRPGAWKELLDLWVELGHKRDSLMGLAVADKLVFYKADSVHTDSMPILKWASE